MHRKNGRKEFKLPPGLQLNTKQQMDGLSLLKKIDDACIPLVLFDPQYRGVLDKQRYGNEGARLKDRFKLTHMSDELIQQFFKEIERILTPSGHVMLWVDKYILLNTVKTFTLGTSLQLVDMITWNKQRIGLGYRSRRASEYLVIFQNPPVRVKDVWTVRNIPDVWNEKVKRTGHAHAKPITLQEQLILAVTKPDDVVIDPCAGGYSSLVATSRANRQFLGCDLLG